MLVAAFRHPHECKRNKCICSPRLQRNRRLDWLEVCPFLWRQCASNSILGQVRSGQVKLSCWTVDCLWCLLEPSWWRLLSMWCWCHVTLIYLTLCIQWTSVPYYYSTKYIGLHGLIHHGPHRPWKHSFDFRALHFGSESGWSSSTTLQRDWGLGPRRSQPVGQIKLSGQTLRTVMHGRKLMPNWFGVIITSINMDKYKKWKHECKFVNPEAWS